MTEIIELLSKERGQYLVYLGLSVGVMTLTGILYFSDKLLFQRFIGKIDPILAFLVVTVLGGLLLTFLLYRGWFSIYLKGNLASLLPYLALTALFLIPSLLVDIRIGFPADINILFPKSLLFYPTIGFLVEILFHVLPLTILLLSLTAIFKNTSYTSILWVCILTVALLEPVFQTRLMVSSSQFHFWAIAIIGLNLYIFDLVQLLIFKRFDFVSMYSFRLAYYLLWHILWGYLRLKILF